MFEDFEGSNVYQVWTDGCCIPNPGPGGWGCVLRLNGQVVEETCGGERRTTSNRMEMTAPLRGIDSALKLGAEKIHVFTDSQYLQKGAMSWCIKWHKKGWQDKDGERKNADLWREIHHRVHVRHPGLITFHWVKGHAGVFYNGRADQLAEVGRLQQVRPGTRAAS